MLRVIFAWLICAAASNADEFNLYILAGQSNMDGYGKVSDLPKSLDQTFEDVLIYHADPTFQASPGGGHDGIAFWQELAPGHGWGYRNVHPEREAGEIGRGPLYSDRFGPELAFAARLRELNPEGRKVAIIKLAIGGTSLDARADVGAGTWDPSVPASITDDLIAAVNSAHLLRDIDRDGEDDNLYPAGIIWMQGETDGMHPEAAADYERNLAAFIEIVRASMRVPDLPVVIGRISDSGQSGDGNVWDHGDLVRAAQQRIADSDPFVSIITETDEYSYSDPYHYDTDGYIRLGRAFANEVNELSISHIFEFMKNVP